MKRPHIKENIKLKKFDTGIPAPEQIPWSIQEPVQEQNKLARLRKLKEKTKKVAKKIAKKAEEAAQEAAIKAEESAQEAAIKASPKGLQEEAEEEEDYGMSM